MMFFDKTCQFGLRASLSTSKPLKIVIFEPTSLQLLLLHPRRTSFDVSNQKNEQNISASTRQQYIYDDVQASVAKTREMWQIHEI